LRPPAKSYRSWPRPTPRIPALRLSAPSVRFIALAIFATDVRAFECALSSLTSSFRPRTAMRCRLLCRHEQSPDALLSQEIYRRCISHAKGRAANLTYEGGEIDLLAAWLESTQQFRLLRGKLGLGQNAPGVQFGHPLYRREYVHVPASSSAGRGLLLRGRIMH
jgi:hypothetical protein